MSRCNTTSIPREALAVARCFDQYGWVVAVNFSIIEADLDERVPVGSLNFGMRVGALWDFIDFIECCTSAMPIRDGGRPLHPAHLPVYRVPAVP